MEFKYKFLIGWPITKLNRYIIQVGWSITLIMLLSVACIMYLLLCKHLNIMSAYLIYVTFMLYLCQYYVIGTGFMSDLWWSNTKIVVLCRIDVIEFVFCLFKFFWSDLDYVDLILIMLELSSSLQSCFFRCSADSNYDRIMSFSSDLCVSLISWFPLWLNYDWIMLSLSDLCFSFGSIDLNYD